VKTIIATITATFLMSLMGSQVVLASPKEDLKSFRAYFKSKFPDTPFDDFINGVYAIDPPSREQWEAIEEFPPYEINIDNGEGLFNKPFKNGKTYADCFDNGGENVRQNYPHFDEASSQVVTLEMAINECRIKNGEAPLGLGKGDIADISAYMAFTSRGSRFDVGIPNKDAEDWYEKGKHFFYAKRGQLNMACADCHVYYSGSYARAELLSPALGQPTHFPVYRSKWGGLGTLQRRYEGCNKQVRARPFKLQGEEYRALEYFHTYMSNGLEVNGPGARK